MAGIPDAMAQNGRSRRGHTRPSNYLILKEPFFSPEGTAPVSVVSNAPVLHAPTVLQKPSCRRGAVIGRYPPDRLKAAAPRKDVIRHVTRCPVLEQRRVPSTLRRAMSGGGCDQYDTRLIDNQIAGITRLSYRRSAREPFSGSPATPNQKSNRRPS